MRAVFLGKSGRTGIQVQYASVQLLPGRHVRVAMKEDIARGKGRQVVLVEHMAMSGKNRPILYEEQARIRQDGKGQYHLIDIGITISPYRRNGDRKTGQHGYDRPGIVLPGKVVARPMIQNITQEQQPSGPFPFHRFHQQPAIVSRTMNL